LCSGGSHEGHNGYEGQQDAHMLVCLDDQKYVDDPVMFANELLRLAEDRVPEGAYCLRKRPSKLRPSVLAT
jgi:hypothetical protein